MKYNNVEILCNTDRSPAWPKGIVGSISHSNMWAGAAIAPSTLLRGVGIDFETVGRVDKEVAAIIANPYDLMACPNLTQSEFWTLLVSAKESLFKSLFPIHQKFFYFDAAFLSDIDYKNGTFQISLTPNYSELAVNGVGVFFGKFKFHQNQCLSVIEIPT